MKSNEIRIIPKFIQELLEHNIPVQLTKDSFVIEGFYKSGIVEVKCQDNSDWYAHSRYDAVTSIKDLQDIIALNYYCWQFSKERFEGWNQPDSRWVKLLEKYRYITAEIVPAKVVYK